MMRFFFATLFISIFTASALLSTGAPASASEDNMTSDISLFVNADGSVGAKANGRIVIDGLSPVMFLPSAILKNASGLSFKESSKDTGYDELGKYESLTAVFEGKSGDRISLRARARSGIHGSGVVTASLITSGKMPLRPEPSLGMNVSLPGLRRAQGSERFKQYWTRPFFTSDIAAAPKNTQFLLWEAGSFYGAMIPLVGNGLRGMIENTEGFGVFSASFDFSYKPRGETPILAVAVGPNPYKAVDAVYTAGMNAMGNPGRLRVDKHYPDMFNYIGWCSWNAFYSMVTRDAVLQSAKSFKKAGFPVKYFIIDDGWQSETDRLLTAFEANQKFPGGLAPLIRTLKGSYGIRWTGVWHAFQGYWNGVKPDSDLAKKYRKNLFETFVRNLIPDCSSDAGYKFFYDYHDSMRRSGVDLVKVDNQSTMSIFSQNKLPIANAMRQQQKNLQGSVNLNFNGAIINCMEMTIENVYFWMTSNVSRNSDDFFPEIDGNARVHALHNVYNSLWVSQLAWPDFDMFQSHHPQAEMHAALRAVSGGPVYSTDTPGKQNFKLLWKFIGPDGKLLRPDGPLLPSPDSLFTDPTATPGIPLKAFNTAGKTGILAVFNVTNGGGAASGNISSADIPPLKGKNFAVFEHFSGRIISLPAGNKLPVELKEYQTAIYSFTPITNGFAPIGLTDKFISAAAVQRVETAPGEHTVDISAPGEFAAWLEKKPVSVAVNGKNFTASAYSWKNKTFRMKIPANASLPVVLKIRTGK